MTVVAGSVRECSINSQIYQSPADTAVKINTGADSNEVVPTGSGPPILQKTKMPAGAEGLVVAIDNDSNDLKSLTDIANGSEFVPVTITLMDNSTYSGDMQIVDGVNYDTQKGTCELKLAGAAFELQ